MSIGSFLATAGLAGQSMRAEEAAMREAQQQQLAIEALNRQEKARREVNALPPAALAAPDFKLGAPLQVIEPEVVKGGRAGVELITSEGLPATTGGAQTAGVKTDAAPAPAAKAKVSQRTVSGVYVPMYNSKMPDRLNTSGVSGFGVISPNASQFERDRINSTNEARLDKLVRAMKANTPLSGITKYFSPQDKKKAIENRENANTWYGSDQAKKYFRRNPEMISVASKDSIGFYNALMGYSKAAPEGGRWRGQAAPAKVAGAPAAGAAPAKSKILPNGFPQSYKDPVYDFAEQQAAAKVGIPVELLQAVRLAGERTDADRVSSAGARTPYQFTPQTRKLFMNKYKVDPWSTPINAATAAAYHLKESLDKGLSNEDALREYHGGPDRKKWGKVNDAYASRTMAFLGGAPASGAGGAGVQLAGSVAETPVPVRIDPSNFYRASPDAVPRDMQVALQKRTRLAQVAGAYQRSGMGAEYLQATMAVEELDNSLAFLQGMQGIQELGIAKDPRRLAAVWSYYTGVPVQLQPQTDGTYNVMVNGRVTQRGVSEDTIISSARSSFDAEYRNAQAASSSAMAMKQFESGLKIGEQAAKTLGDLTSALEQKKLEGATARDLEQLKNDLKIELERQNPEAKVTMTGDGTGSAILSYKDGRVATFTPGGEIEINGQTVKTAPTVRAVGVGN